MIGDGKDFFIVNQNIYRPLGFRVYDNAIIEIITNFKENEDYIVIKNYENAVYKPDDNYKLKYLINAKTYLKMLVKAGTPEGRKYRQELINDFKPFEAKVNEKMKESHEILKHLGKIKIITLNNKLIIEKDLSVREIQELLSKIDVNFKVSDSRKKLLDNLVVKTIIF